MATHIRHHRLPALRPKGCQTPAQFLQLAPESLPLRLASQGETAPTGAPYVVRETQEIEGLRPSPAIATAAPQGVSPEAQYRGLGRFGLQAELPQPLGEFREKPPILFVREARHKVVGVAHQVRRAPAGVHIPLLEPQVQYVVQVDVASTRRDQPALRRSGFRVAELSR